MDHVGHQRLFFVTAVANVENSAHIQYCTANFIEYKVVASEDIDDGKCRIKYICPGPSHGGGGN